MCGWCVSVWCGYVVGGVYEETNSENTYMYSKSHHPI